MVEATNTPLLYDVLAKDKDTYYAKLDQAFDIHIKMKSAMNNIQSLISKNFGLTKKFFLTINFSRDWV